MLLTAYGLKIKFYALVALAMFGLFFSISIEAGDIELGKETYAQKGCTACHGAEGISMIPTYPNIAGQKEAYIIDSVNQYKTGARNNTIMAPMSTTVNDDEIKNIAAYLASLK